MVMTVTVRQLEVFAAVAQQGSVTRGAQRLHLTQSAASMSLKQLERVLGGPLFARIVTDADTWTQSCPYAATP